VEGPGVGDDLAQVGLGRVPAKLAARLVGGGDRGRGVAGPPGRHLDRDREAGYLAGRVDDLLVAVAVAVAEVVDLVPAWPDRRQGEQVGGGQVGDVNVVADAGAVRGRVVVAVQQQLVALPVSDLEDEGDQVAFRAVPLAQPAHRARGVEVAQARGGKAERLALSCQHQVHRQLGGGVCVARADRRVFGQLPGTGVVHRAGGGEDQPRYLGGPHGVEEGHRSRHVDVPVQVRARHRLRDLDLPGEVQHRLEARPGRQHPRRLVHRQPAELHAVRDVIGVARRQVVEHDHLMPRRCQGVRHHAPDVSRAASHQHLHSH
jgi:hypothetical protein